VNAHRQDVQILRALALVGIVAFHAFPKAAPLGFLGVDVFFVISGFVIWPRIYSIIMGPKEVRNRKLLVFYLSRATRLLPALFSTLLLFVPLIFLLGANSDFQRSAIQAIGAILIASNFTALLTTGNYFNPFPNAFLHTWSLSLEEQIYLILPIACILIIKLKKEILSALGLLAILSFSLSFGTSVLSNLATQEFSSLYLHKIISKFELLFFYLPFTRFWEFFIGVLIAQLSNSSQSRNKSFVKLKGKSFVGFAPFLCIFALYFSKFSFSEYLTIFACTLSAAFILLSPKDPIEHFIFRSLASIGDKSYSLYLVHMPIAYIANYSPIVLIQSQARQFICSLLIFPATFVIGWSLYYLVENRFRLRFEKMENLSFAQRQSKQKFLLKFGSMTFIATTLLIPINQKIVSIANEGELPRYAGVDQSKICKPLGYLSSVPCLLNSPKVEYREIRIAFVGNSHTVQFLAEFERFSKENSAYAVYLGDITDSKALDRILSEFKIDSVIVSRKWEDDFNVEGEQIKLLRFLAQQERNVIILDQVPTFPDGLLYFQNSNFLMSSYKEPKIFPEREMLREWTNIHESLESQSESLGLQFIGLKDVLCSKGFCTRYFDGNWLYWDDDHLSMLGARFVFSKIEVTLAKLLEFNQTTFK
jgi:peptidoglycan/LPS O-acetylase OafA/YrhL